jgi:hypothetical protein
LHKVNASLGGDQCRGGTDDSKLQPEAARANRDRLASDLLALLGAPEDINEVNSFASWKRSGSGTERWETGETCDSVAQRLWHGVDREDLPASGGERAQDAVGGAVWAGRCANDRNGATLRQHAAHERVYCGRLRGAPFGGLYGCP